VAVSYRELRTVTLSLTANSNLLWTYGSQLVIRAAARTTQKSQFYCCIRKTTEKTSHVIIISPVHWRADCCLAMSYKHSFSKIQLLLLRVEPCLQSCCLAMPWSNPLQYYAFVSHTSECLKSIDLHSKLKWCLWWSRTRIIMILFSTRIILEGKYTTVLICSLFTYAVRNTHIALNGLIVMKSELEKMWKELVMA
jgi:hypothetical protein